VGEATKPVRKVARAGIGKGRVSESSMMLSGVRVAWWAATTLRRATVEASGISGIVRSAWWIFGWYIAR
jgi:hypothetical protein